MSDTPTTVTRTGDGAASAAAEIGAPPSRLTGILPSQDIRRLVAAGAVAAADTVSEAQIQPASLDLRLADVAYRVRAGFLPGRGVTVMERIREVGMHEVPLRGGAVLERGCVYIVPLMESLRLGGGLSGAANPKSSTGRLDIFTRLLTDGSEAFDQVAAGYFGPLYLEVSPRTFSVVVRTGSRLNQLRLHQGPIIADAAASGLPLPAPSEGIAVTVDLVERGGGLIGWRARRHADLIDLGRVDYYAPLDFFEPVRVERAGALVLNPGDFYILASKEAVAVPPDQAAEMHAYDTRVGEFRVHYAGFFDPGFGDATCGGSGSRAVLEIRSFEVPFVLRDGQRVGRLKYEPLTGVPDKLYGSGIGSSYQRQGLALAKQFRRE